jgi:hypothetical protein
MRWLPVLFLIGLLAAPAAQAQDETVSVTIERFVEFVDKDTVQASLTVTCSSDGVVLEAFAYVVQRAHNSDFRFFAPICDGVPHTLEVSIHAAEGERFRRGRARVSAFVLLESGATTSPSQTVIIR